MPPINSINPSPQTSSPQVRSTPIANVASQAPSTTSKKPPQAQSQPGTSGGFTGAGFVKRPKNAAQNQGAPPSAPAYDPRGNASPKGAGVSAPVVLKGSTRPAAPAMRYYYRGGRKVFELHISTEIMIMQQISLCVVICTRHYRAWQLADTGWSFWS